MSITDSTISDNSASLVTSSSAPDDHVAIAGGIHVEDFATATITRTIVSGNSVSASTSAGTAVGVAGGIDVDGTLTIDASRIDHNSTSATSPTLAIAGGAFDVDGSLTIRNSIVVGNHGDASPAAPAGPHSPAAVASRYFAKTSIDPTRDHRQRG